MIRVKTRTRRTRGASVPFLAQILPLDALSLGLSLLLAAAIVPQLVPSGESLKQVFALLSFAVIGLTQLRKKRRGKLHPHYLIMWAAFFTLVFVSSIFSEQFSLSMNYSVLTLFGFVMLYVYLTRARRRSVLLGLSRYTIVAATVLLLLMLYDYTPGVRLGYATGVLNPNAFGMLAMGVAVTSLMMRFSLFTVYNLVVAGAVFTLSGSRSVLVGTFAVLMLILMRHLVRTARGRTGISLLAIILPAIAIVIYVVQELIVEGVVETLDLDDPNRGIESGGSGRFALWAEAFKLAMNNPLVGVGFRAHEQYIIGGSSSHNGYLAFLSEVGVIGFVLLLIILIPSIFRLLRGFLFNHKRSPKLNDVFVGITFSYLVVAIFERYMISVGNPVSVMFLMALLYTQLSYRSQRSRRKRKIKKLR